MKNTFETKKQPIVRTLLLGLITLILCLITCSIMVSFTKTAYEKELQSNLYDIHENVSCIANDMMDGTNNIVLKAAKSLEDNSYNMDNDRINYVISLVKSSGYGIDAFYYSSTGVVYSGDAAVPSNERDDAWLQNTSSFSNKKDDIYSTIIDDKGYEFLSVAPVYRGESFKGYFVATLNLSEMFSKKTYETVTSIGEIFVIGYDGVILYKNDNSEFVGDGEINLFSCINSYCDKSTRTENKNKSMKTSMAAGESGYNIYRTRNGYSKQVIYSQVDCINKACLVTIYRDNYVEDLIQPIVYRCTLSCIVIIVLMVAIIIFVWATAKNANLTIEKLAYEDSVTKGKNINYFKEFALHVMNVFKETPFIIYRFDIMNFRYINEAYGHKRADEVLACCVREFGKVFSDKELCVRMDSDQFLALVVNDPGLETKMKQYQDKVNEESRGYGIKYPIRFKMGIYQVRKNEHNIDVMIDHANVARKTLAGDEKQLKSVYSEKVVNDMRKIDRIESEMQHALATGEFKVFIQPKWDIGSNSICGGEALVRWIKNDGTMVYPDEFIPIFENDGFIEKLDFFMLEKVCEYMRDAMNERRTIYPISVNQSRILLHSPDYVFNVKKIIDEYNIPAGYIQLEVTESVFDNERVSIIKLMKELKDIGVRFAMDDFGSGYSSLNMLKDIPFDIIKIDREFFSESVTGKVTLWILQKIIEMVNGLGKELVCEGVETEEQSTLLRNMGCRIVQGYLYSKPIDYNEYLDKYCRKYD